MVGFNFVPELIKIPFDFVDFSISAEFHLWAFNNFLCCFTVTVTKPIKANFLDVQTHLPGK